MPLILDPTLQNTDVALKIGDSERFLILKNMCISSGVKTMAWVTANSPARNTALAVGLDSVSVVCDGTKWILN